MLKPAAPTHSRSNMLWIDTDLQNQLDELVDAPPTFSTLVSRAQLSQQYLSLAKDQERICARLVHEQHQQQQGWFACIANLEDIYDSFQGRIKDFEHNFTGYLEARSRHLNLVGCFTEDIPILRKIPILPALKGYALGDFGISPDDEPRQLQIENGNQQQQQQQQQQEQQQEDGNMIVGTNERSITLCEWISTKDTRTTLEEACESYSRGIELYDENTLEQLKIDINNLLLPAAKSEMKEIKGLGERLYQLEALMVQVRKLVAEQNDLAQSFQANMKRVSNLNDDSVLPDLSESHIKQLLVMQKNHNQLRDIRRRCTKAKEELSASLHRRLKWVVDLECKLSAVDANLLMNGEQTKRMRRQLDILYQIHTSPEMYLMAVCEVVRRRTFSQAFLLWARQLSDQLRSVHNEEVERRNTFMVRFGTHFLTPLFPGLEDIPPPFATVAPPSFDTNLPKLTAEDIELLKRLVPDLADSVATPDLNSITQFFLSKSLSDSNSDVNKESNSMPVDLPPKDQETIKPTLVSDRGEFGSETDTDEFEKIGQAALDSKLTSYEGSAKQHPTQQQFYINHLEECVAKSREENERLRNLVRNMKSVTSDSLLNLRGELNILREHTISERTAASEIVDKVGQMVNVHMESLRQREQEMTVDHELEMADLKKLLLQKDEELQGMKRALMEKEQEVQEQERLARTIMRKYEAELQQVNEFRNVYGQMKERLEHAQAEKENSLKELSEEALLKTNRLESDLEQCQKRIRELEAKAVTSEMEHQKAFKDELEKIQLNYKAQLDTIRSRFKLMTASAMERSPSDSSLEKIERVDVIELVNHETILAQTKKDFELEKEEAIKKAVREERTTLTRDLRMANEIISQHERDLLIYRQRESALLEECKHHKDALQQRLDQAENVIRSLESDKANLKVTCTTNRDEIEQKNNLVEQLKAKQEELKRELDEERLKMSQGNDDLVTSKSSSDKSDIQVSESKKVRLEEDLNSLSVRESDNRHRSHSSRYRNAKERTKRNAYTSDSMMGSAATAIGDNRDMNTSVCVVSDLSLTGVRADSATSMDRRRSDGSGMSSSMRDKFVKSTNSFNQQTKITCSSCNPGDTVLVIWNQEHRNYTVFQESSTIYFLNSDCMPALDLKISSDGTPEKLHTLAEVIDKEYCSARKTENRYKVPKGTKFYRVRVAAHKKSNAAVTPGKSQ
ncbi:RB1-inducible coiled-coil protein 1 isoform X2 [Trichogramma pretiosum]|uniref:RB1-inducible coiled-coil protein 1 isoform X2 n=1 Tax=Trichogramma pretiosum TaxID=7493 RepID=UPI0006C9D9E5|nr:RB1-inducible coiled-coil protein 1 isoform X2 [Trichogramma pretiosum]